MEHRINDDDFNDVGLFDRIRGILGLSTLVGAVGYQQLRSQRIKRDRIADTFFRKTENTVIRKYQKEIDDRVFNGIDYQDLQTQITESRGRGVVVNTGMSDFDKIIKATNAGGEDFDVAKGRLNPTDEVFVREYHEMILNDIDKPDIERANNILEKKSAWLERRTQEDLRLVDEARSRSREAAGFGDARKAYEVAAETHLNVNAKNTKGHDYRDQGYKPGSTSSTANNFIPTVVKDTSNGVEITRTSFGYNTKTGKYDLPVVDKIQVPVFGPNGARLVNGVAQTPVVKISVDGRFTESEVINANNSGNTPYLYSGGNKNTLTAPAGMSAADVLRITNHPNVVATNSAKLQYWSLLKQVQTGYYGGDAARGSQYNAAAMLERVTDSNGNFVGKDVRGGVISYDQLDPVQASTIDQRILRVRSTTIFGEDINDGGAHLIGNTTNEIVGVGSNGNVVSSNVIKMQIQDAKILATRTTHSGLANQYGVEIADQLTNNGTDVVSRISAKKIPLHATAIGESIVYDYNKFSELKEDYVKMIKAKGGSVREANKTIGKLMSFLDIKEDTIQRNTYGQLTLNPTKTGSFYDPKSVLQTRKNAEDFLVGDFFNTFNKIGSEYVDYMGSVIESPSKDLSKAPMNRFFVTQNNKLVGFTRTANAVIHDSDPTDSKGSAQASTLVGGYRSNDTRGVKLSSRSMHWYAENTREAFIQAKGSGDLDNVRFPNAKMLMSNFVDKTNQPTIEGNLVGAVAGLNSKGKPSYNFHNIELIDKAKDISRLVDNITSDKWTKHMDSMNWGLLVSELEEHLFEFKELNGGSDLITVNLKDNAKLAIERGGSKRSVVDLFEKLSKNGIGDKTTMNLQPVFNTLINIDPVTGKPVFQSAFKNAIRFISNLDGKNSEPLAYINTMYENAMDEVMGKSGYAGDASYVSGNTAVIVESESYRNLYQSNIESYQPRRSLTSQRIEDKFDYEYSINEKKVLAKENVHSSKHENFNNNRTEVRMVNKMSALIYEMDGLNLEDDEIGTNNAMQYMNQSKDSDGIKIYERQSREVLKEVNEYKLLKQNADLSTPKAKKKAYKMQKTKMNKILRLIESRDQHKHAVTEALNIDTDRELMTNVLDEERSLKVRKIADSSHGKNVYKSLEYFGGSDDSYNGMEYSIEQERELYELYKENEEVFIPESMENTPYSKAEAKRKSAIAADDLVDKHQAKVVGHNRNAILMHNEILNKLSAVEYGITPEMELLMPEKSGVNEVFINSGMASKALKHTSMGAFIDQYGVEQLDTELYGYAIREPGITEDFKAGVKINIIDAKVKPISAEELFNRFKKEQIKFNNGQDGLFNKGFDDYFGMNKSVTYEEFVDEVKESEKAKTKFYEDADSVNIRDEYHGSELKPRRGRSVRSPKFSDSKSSDMEFALSEEAERRIYLSRQLKSLEKHYSNQTGMMNDDDVIGVNIGGVNKADFDKDLFSLTYGITPYEEFEYMNKELGILKAQDPRGKLLAFTEEIADLKAKGYANIKSHQQTIFKLRAMLEEAIEDSGLDRKNIVTVGRSAMLQNLDAIDVMSEYEKDASSKLIDSSIARHLSSVEEAQSDGMKAKILVRNKKSGVMEFYNATMRDKYQVSEGNDLLTSFGKDLIDNADLSVSTDEELVDAGLRTRHTDTTDYYTVNDVSRMGKKSQYQGDFIEPSEGSSIRVMAQKQAKLSNMSPSEVQRLHIESRLPTIDAKETMPFGFAGGEKARQLMDAQSIMADNENSMVALQRLGQVVNQTTLNMKLNAHSFQIDVTKDFNNTMSKLLDPATTNKMVDESVDKLAKGDFEIEHSVMQTNIRKILNDVDVIKDMSERKLDATAIENEVLSVFSHMDNTSEVYTPVKLSGIISHIDGIGQGVIPKDSTLSQSLQGTNGFTDSARAFMHKISLESSIRETEVEAELAGELTTGKMNARIEVIKTEMKQRISDSQSRLARDKQHIHALNPVVNRANAQSALNASVEHQRFTDLPSRFLAENKIVDLLENRPTTKGILHVGTNRLVRGGYKTKRIGGMIGMAALGYLGAKAFSDGNAGGYLGRNAVGLDNFASMRDSIREEEVKLLEIKTATNHQKMSSRHPIFITKYDGRDPNAIYNPQKGNF